MKVIRIIDTTRILLYSLGQLFLIALNDVLSPVERALSSLCIAKKLHTAEVYRGITKTEVLKSRNVEVKFVRYLGRSSRRTSNAQ